MTCKKAFPSVLLGIVDAAYGWMRFTRFYFAVNNHRDTAAEFSAGYKAANDNLCSSKQVLDLISLFFLSFSLSFLSVLHTPSSYMTLAHGRCNQAKTVKDREKESKKEWDESNKRDAGILDGTKKKGGTDETDRILRDEKREARTSI